MRRSLRWILLCQVGDYLMTYAPFPGNTAWISFDLGLGVVWSFHCGLSSLCSLRCASRKVIMDHQTEWIGGGIQLYFAGPSPFATSDVVIDTTTNKRSQIALGGLIAPTLVAIVLWLTWKETQQPDTLLFRCILALPNGMCFR